MSWMGKQTLFSQKRRIAKILAFTVILAAVLVIIGWVFDIGLLKSFSSSGINMKLDTAVTFLLSGISLYFMARAGILTITNFSKLQKKLKAIGVALGGQGPWRLWPATPQYYSCCSGQD